MSNYNPVELFNQLKKGDRVALSRAITLVESNKWEHQILSNELLALCNSNQKSIRIGITGVPGVGKSTFIEAFGMHLIKCGKKLAVLSIDPSSKISGGSILGDKTRMSNLSQEENAYIRPSASRNYLGGVSLSTPKVIMLCEAAGYDVILVETVGVGQSETVVHQMTDFFLLLMLFGAGDELQGIKRGVIEMADALIINKADGENVINAKKAAMAYKNVLHLFPNKPSEWIPFVDVCSAIESNNIDKIWDKILSYMNKTMLNGYFLENRKQQEIKWFEESLDAIIKQLFFREPEKLKIYNTVKEQIEKGNINPFEALSKFM